MIESFVLTIGLLINLPETLCFDVRRSQWGRPRPDTAFRLHSTSTIKPQSAAILEADELRVMYAEIASKDPQWLHEFVIDMFDEDDEDLLAIIRQAEKDSAKSNLSKKETSAAASQTIVANFPTSSSPQTPVENDKEESKEVANVSLQNVTTAKIQQNNNTTTAHKVSQSSVERAKNETKGVTESKKIAVDASSRNVTDEALARNNTEAKVPIEKDNLEKKAITSDQLLDLGSKTKERGPSSQFINQQSTATGSILSGVHEKPSLVKDRNLLGTNTSASLISNETAVKEDDSLRPSTVKLQNTSASLNQTQNTSLSEKVWTRTTASSATETRRNIGDKTDEVVVFSDSRLKKKQKVSLSKLNVLGYTTEEVLALDPDALSLIVEDTLRKPSSGVPASWKSDKKLIRIEASDDLVDEALKLHSTSKSIPESLDDKVTVKATSSAPATLNVGKSPEVKVRRGIVDGSTPVTTRINQTSKRTEDGTAAAELGSSASMKEERKRRVFTGRPEPSPPRDDPPPPKAFWPDIDTFRSLLRKEASLRLQILGDGWSKTVKDESEWRLELYKNWLWTLHTGVGDPLVESRSDRMRRSSRDLARTQSKTKGTPSDSQRERRQRDD